MTHHPEFTTEYFAPRKYRQFCQFSENEVFEDRVSDGEEELAIKYKIECFNVKYVVNIYRSG